MGKGHGSGPHLAAGRSAYAEKAWTVAHRELTAADQIEALAPSDLELLSTASYMLGDVAAMRNSLERAYHGYVSLGDDRAGARVALWLATNIASRGKLVESSGWVERGRRLLDSQETDCVERGYLLLPAALRYVIEGDMAQVESSAAEAASIGRRFEDHDLVALAAQTQSRALLHLGRATEGFRLLDEVMLSVLAGECSPMVTGLVYCSVIEGCYEVHEIRRAAAWTDSLADWCGGQSDLVAFTDQCLAHRAEILKLQGAWSGALTEAQRSHDNQARGGAAAQASYQQAEIHRMRGDLKAADEAFEAVGRSGGEPQPGLARLRLAQGNEDAAVASIRRALMEATDLLDRVRILPGFVDVMVETGFIDEAESAAHELSEIAERTMIEMHRAWAAHGTGSVALARADPVEAAARFREAMRLWDDLGLPYEAALARMSCGRAMRAMGDEDAAQVQFEAARTSLTRLGAAPAARAAAALAKRESEGNLFGLTDREIEVLRAVTSGATNRAIAAELVLSERTIDRHVSNIFSKLGVTTRSAATALAIRHRMV